MPDSYFSVVRREPYLTAYWRQNEVASTVNMIDYGEYDLTGTYTNRSAGPALIQGDSTAGSSVCTIGGGQVTNISQLQITGDISIEGWVTPYSPVWTGSLIAKMNVANNFAAPYEFLVSHGALVFNLGNGTTVTSLAGPTIPVGSPSHIVATCFRGLMSIYLNGDQVAAGVLGSQTVVDAGQPLYVGRFGFTSGVNLIAEAAIYNGALSARRIARHFTIGQQVLSDPAHYTLVDPPVLT